MSNILLLGNNMSTYQYLGLFIDTHTVIYHYQYELAVNRIPEYHGYFY